MLASLWNRNWKLSLFALNCRIRRYHRKWPCSTIRRTSTSSRSYWIPSLTMDAPRPRSRHSPRISMANHWRAVWPRCVARRPTCMWWRKCSSSAKSLTRRVMWSRMSPPCASYPLASCSTWVDSTSPLPVLLWLLFSSPDLQLHFGQGCWHPVACP